jgi:hypothetical protein
MSHANVQETPGMALMRMSHANVQETPDASKAMAMVTPS